MSKQIENKVQKLKSIAISQFHKDLIKEIKPMILKKAKTIAKKYPQIKSIVIGMGTATVHFQDKFKHLDGYIFNEKKDIEPLINLLSDLQNDEFGFCFDDIDLDELRKEC